MKKFTSFSRGVAGYSGTLKTRGGSSSDAPIVSGGEITESGGYVYHTFATSGQFTVTDPKTATFDILIVGGGGSGGDRHGGGGGAGGYQSFEGISLIAGDYTVSIGAGAAGGSYEANNSYPRGSGLKGSDTTFGTLQTSYGGRGGGTYNGNPTQTPVGSTGGGGGNRTGQTGATVGQGNNGGGGTSRYYGGGGGGAGAPGNAGAGTTNTGGDGLQWLNGNYYAGGGGGAGSSGNYPSGGLGGGGQGAWDYGYTDGSANTGGGGGATRSSNTATIGANGGSGIVIVRYAL